MASRFKDSFCAAFLRRLDQEGTSAAVTPTTLLNKPEIALEIRYDPTQQVRLPPPQYSDKLRCVRLTDVEDLDAFPKWSREWEARLVRPEPGDHVVFVSHRWRGDDADGGELYARRILTMLRRDGLLLPTQCKSWVLAMMLGFLRKEVPEGDAIANYVNAYGKFPPGMDDQFKDQWSKLEGEPLSTVFATASPPVLLNGEWVNCHAGPHAKDVIGYTRAPLPTSKQARDRILLFFDYTCLPQKNKNGKRTEDETNLFNDRLMAMNDYVAVCDTLVAIPGRDLRYADSAWCIYEYGTALMDRKSFHFAVNLNLEYHAAILRQGMGLVASFVYKYFEQADEFLRANSIFETESIDRLMAEASSFVLMQLRVSNAVASLVLLYFHRIMKTHVASDMKKILHLFHMRIYQSARAIFGTLPPLICIQHRVNIAEGVKFLLMVSEDQSNATLEGGIELSVPEVLNGIESFCARFDTGYDLRYQLDRPTLDTMIEEESMRWMIMHACFTKYEQTKELQATEMQVKEKQRLRNHQIRRSISMMALGLVMIFAGFAFLFNSSHVGNVPSRDPVVHGPHLPRSLQLRRLKFPELQRAAKEEETQTQGTCLEAQGRSRCVKEEL